MRFVLIFVLFWVQRCYKEKTFSPCGKNAEESRLTRSSSVEGVASGVQRGPYLGRSCSVPAERHRRVAGLSPQVLAWVAASAVNVNTPASLPQFKSHPNPSQASELRGNQFLSLMSSILYDHGIFFIFWGSECCQPVYVIMVCNCVFLCLL